MSRNVYSAVPTRGGGPGCINPEVISRAGQEIVRALRGLYTTPDGKSLPVQGDMRKVYIRQLLVRWHED